MNASNVLVGFFRQYIALLAGALLMSCVSGASAGSDSYRTVAPEPSSVLFVGNSFFYHNDGINEHLLKLIRSFDAQTTFRTTLVAISGSGLDWHDVASYFRPDAIGRYSFDLNNDIVFNKRAKALFDVTVMMDCSQCPLHPKLRSGFYSSVAKDSEIVRRFGSAPVLFMSWAYQDRPEMTQSLADAYTLAGAQNHALVIPAGLAFASVVRQYPSINLYAVDKRHPSVAGTYLATCTVYAALFGKSPVGASYDAGLDPAIAQELQSAAWQTVQAYLPGAQRASSAPP